MKKLLTIVLMLLCFVSKAQNKKVNHKENTPVQLGDTILYEHYAHLVPHQKFILPHDAYVYKVTSGKPYGSLWVDRRTGERYNRYTEATTTFLSEGSYSGINAERDRKWRNQYHFVDSKVSSENTAFDLYYLTFYKCKDGEQGDEFPKDGSLVAVLDTQLYVHHVHVDSGYGCMLPQNAYLNRIVAFPSKKNGKNTVARIYADGHVEQGFNGGMVPEFTEDSRRDITFKWGSGEYVCAGVKTAYGSMDVYYLTFEAVTDKPKLVRIE